MPSDNSTLNRKGGEAQRPQIYLAARYSRRLELCHYREQLAEMGHFIQARWLNGGHQLDDVGKPIGDSGEQLVEGTGAASEVRAAELRAKFAQDDWEDVSTADWVISFTEAPRTTGNRGGRHVEFGIALANRARVTVIGYRENIFHWLPQVEFFSTWPEFLSSLCASASRR
jgi:hypothetical protein